MKWIGILIVILAVLAVLTVFLTLFFFSFAIRRNDKCTVDAAVERMRKKTPPDQFAVVKKGVDGFIAAPKEDVYMTSRDGLKLHAYLLEQPDPTAARGTIVLVHGWRSHPEIDFSASWAYYLEKGLNVLAINQRTFGKSEGKYTCFGVKERFDLIDWINLINERYGKDKKVIVSGISMGASTVMMALGEDSFPANVVGATADCGFVSAWDEFAHVLRRSYHLPKFPLMYTTDLLSRAVADFPFRACSTEQALKNARIPVLFIHGLADDFVPPEHSRRSAAACASPYELIEVEGAGHGLSYLVDTKTVAEKLDAFFERILNE